MKSEYIFNPSIPNRLQQAVSQRNSSFELLRILSQVFIVLYHICYIWQGKEYSSQPFFQAVSIPLHIGVVVFVLLSGYFTIKLKVMGGGETIGHILCVLSARGYIQCCDSKGYSACGSSVDVLF